MVKWQRINSTVARLLREGIRTTHNRIVLVGLLLGLCYLPMWLISLTERAIHGSAGPMIAVAAVYFGLQPLWSRRQQLAKMVASEEDQLLGHLLILSAVALFPFCLFAIWPLSILWIIVLAGIACSSWGVGFFQRFPVPTVLMALSAYPTPGTTVKIIWKTLTPPQMLESWMAWVGSVALRAIHYPAQAQADLILLPEGSVRVDWGCSGFSMAFTLAGVGLVLGLFFKQSWSKTISLIILGVLIALVLNIPRIMLVTIAAVYWGQDWFKFWHETWGAQMFVGGMLTVYYYLFMGIINRRSAKPKKSA